MDNKADKSKIKAKQRQNANDPLHGITLEQIVKSLVDYYGWGELGERINIKCFNIDPSVKSSLKFLRKTPWARQRVEGLYMYMQRCKRRRGQKKRS